MKKCYCDSCRKEIKKNTRNIIEVYYASPWVSGNDTRYELCDACYAAMQREIPRLLNWRNGLR